MVLFPEQRLVVRVSGSLTLNTRFAAPAVPVRASHGPDGTRPSSDSIATPLGAVGAARALDSRRAHELRGRRCRQTCAHMTFAQRFAGTGKM